MSNYTVKLSCVKASIISPTAADGEPHDFIAAISGICSSRPEQQDTPLANFNLKVFVDDLVSCIPDTSENKVGYVVITEHRQTNGVIHDFETLWKQ